MKNLASACLAVVASVAVASSSHAALVYGGGTQTGSRWNPGAGVITYMNCFTAVTAGQTQLSLENAVLGIRRLTSAGALVDVGVNIYAAAMTYDAVTSTYGAGANTLIYSQASLGGGAATVLQLVNTGAVSGVTLNLETTSNAGLGGFWIGVEFTGANAANTANGWRVIGAPTTGASIDAFGMYNYAASGVFGAFYTFGTVAAPTPSRFMVDVSGTLVPAPGAIALIGVAGLVSRRRRSN